MNIKTASLRSAGYQYFIDKMNLLVLSNWHISFISSANIQSVTVHDDKVEEIYPSRYWPGESISAQLEFALKHDGVNLAILTLIFEKIEQEVLVEMIKIKPTGKFVRKIWFFYEFLTGNKLPIEDLNSGNYIDLLDPDRYYTLENIQKSSRHRINNNLLGPQSFCPLIRKTDKLREFSAYDMNKRCQEIITAYSPSLLRRALTYLYDKETKSSFEIEHVKPDAFKAEKFITSLSLAEKQDFCEKNRVIELQNMIVDTRFVDNDYRQRQNYIGQTVAHQKELVHFICPKPENLSDLMSGLFTCHTQLKSDNFPAVIHAAIIAYGFVFLHPFEDGNGRIHRFLIHNILSLSGMIPKGVMFPISAVMLKHLNDYDKSLEAFSKPLLKLIDYTIDEAGKLTVKNETAHLYQFIDMTIQAEALYEFVIKTIEEELVEELSFLAQYDVTKKAIQEIIDMPDRFINLFIQLTLHNRGKLSARKRESHFSFLTDEELLAIEDAVREGYKNFPEIVKKNFE